MKTYWLSFCDDDKPEGEKFLGVCVVDVTDADAEEAIRVITEKFPNAAAGSEWTLAASRKAHAMGCNPGGQMLSYELTSGWLLLDTCPRNKLMNKARLAELGLV